jgi:hypothetical protein
MQIDESAKPVSNACTYASMSQSLESDSNVMVDRDGQSEKEKLPSSLADDGTRMDDSEECETATRSIEESREPGSKITCERVLHLEKNLLPEYSIFAGMTTSARFPK